LIEANGFAALPELLQVFSDVAIKFKREYKKVPVFIIDNANRLAHQQPKVLDILQDYAKLAVDEGIVTVVFVSSEGFVPNRMMGKSIMFVVLIVMC